MIGIAQSRLLRDAAADGPDASVAEESPEKRRGAGALDDMSINLVSVAERGDREAFSALFRHFGPKIRVWLTRGGGGPSEVDDLLQDVFASVWHKAAQYDRRRASAAAWIYAIARNRRIDAFRRGRRAEFDPEDPAFRHDPEPDGEQAVAERQGAEAVRAALSKLSEEQREVLRLSFYEGESYAAISTRLGIPLGTVKSRARLAFGYLRSELGLHRERY